MPHTVPTRYTFFVFLYILQLVNRCKTHRLQFYLTIHVSLSLPVSLYVSVCMTALCISLSLSFVSPQSRDRRRVFLYQKDVTTEAAH